MAASRLPWTLGFRHAACTYHLHQNIAANHHADASLGGVQLVSHFIFRLYFKIIVVAVVVVVDKNAPFLA
jgi:hypothetical protein